MFSHNPLLFPSDIPWLIDWVQRIGDQALQRFVAQALFARFQSADMEYLEIIFSACETCDALRDAFAPLLNPVDLHSELAKRLRQEHHQHTAWQESEAEHRPQPLSPPPRKRVLLSLDRFEAGELSAWWHANLELTHAPQGTHYGDEFEADLRSLPGWTEADAVTRERLVAAARSYLLRATPNPVDWIGKNLLHRPDYAGYHAFFLLDAEDPSFVHALAPDVWRRWAAVILAFPAPHEVRAEARHQELVRRAHAAAPDIVTDTLLTLIDAENREGRYLTVHRTVERCQDPLLNAAMLRKARDPALKLSGFGSLLEDLIARTDQQAIEYAVSLVTNPPPQELKSRARAYVAAQVLLTHGNGAGWSVIWQVLQGDLVFGKTLMHLVVRLHDEEHAAALARNLSESQIADFFEWLMNAFPRSKDPQHEEMHRVGTRESVGFFRDAVFNQLRSRGTRAALCAIRRLAGALPKVGWLRWAVVDARRTVLLRTWNPPRPADFLKLVRHRDARLIESGGQLLDVVLESLRRLARKLQAEIPAAPDLWDKGGDRLYRPKDEKALSNYVARHLRDDIRDRGLAVHREVEIRPGEGDAEGERTDIIIEASIPGRRLEERDTVSVTVEVKGSWNNELKTALANQLRDRYLADTYCRHGLYLVGWYYCDQWDKDEWRYKNSPKWQAAEAELFFQQQAASESIDDRIIKAFVLNAALR